MSSIPKEWIWIGLLAAAGFLIGGVYVTWKSMKFLAMILVVLALIAGGAAVAWMFS